MDSEEVINGLNRKINSIYFENEIVPLRGFCDDGINFPYILPSGKSFISFTHDVLNGKVQLKQIIEITDDFLFLSDEIIFFTALLYLYRPYIENYIDTAIPTDSTSFLYISDQTIEGKRYDMFVDILYEKIYSFYERIANLINLVYPSLLSKKNNISFSTTIDKLTEKHKKNEDYLWLLNVRKNEFKKMNEQRRNAVHNILTVTRNFNNQRFENYMSYTET